MERSAAAWWWRAVARLDGGQVGHEADELLEEVEDVGADATDDEGQGVVGLLGAQVLGEVADDVAERDDGTREAQRAAGGAERVTDRLQRRAAGLAEKVPAPTPARTPDGSAAAASPDHLPLVALPCMYLHAPGSSGRARTHRTRKLAVDANSTTRAVHCDRTAHDSACISEKHARDPWLRCDTAGAVGLERAQHEAECSRGRTTV